MSSVYATEPVTNGKVVLHTTLGDIDIELWTKECPKTCRNFLQLIMENYYNGLIIHRIIPNLLIQTGDPQGTGQSRTDDIYNGSFDYTKEIHSRIKFNHRGQVAMAENKGSQFFITLDKADWLGSGNSSGTGTNRQYCIFGKVTGPSIYNLVRIAELATDKNDRPLEPPVIQSVEILSSPFDDITIRPESKRGLELQAQTVTIAATMNKMNNGIHRGGGGIGKKPTSHLLSFANNDEENEDDQVNAVPTNPRKSTGTSLISSSTIVPVKKSLVGHHVMENTTDTSSSSSLSLSSSTVPPSSQLTHPVDPHEPSSTTALTIPSVADDTNNKEDRRSEEEMIEMERQRRAQEFLKLTEELRSTRKAIHIGTTHAAAASAEENAKNSLLTPLQAMREKYTQKKRNIGNREAETLAKLAAFQSTLKSVVESSTENPNTSVSLSSSSSSSRTGETYHGQVLENTDTVNIQDASWMSNRLKFKHHLDDSYKGFTNNLIGKTTITSSSSSSSNRSTMDDRSGEADDDGLLTIDPRQSHGSKEAKASHRSDHHHHDHDTDHHRKRRRDSYDDKERY